MLYCRIIYLSVCCLCLWNIIKVNGHGCSCSDCALYCTNCVEPPRFTPTIPLDGPEEATTSTYVSPFTQGGHAPTTLPNAYLSDRTIETTLVSTTTTSTTTAEAVRQTVIVMNSGRVNVQFICPACCHRKYLIYDF